MNVLCGLYVYDHVLFVCMCLHCFFCLSECVCVYVSATSLAHVCVGGNVCIYVVRW